MKIYHALFLIFLLSIIGFQPVNGQESINQFDANGERTGVWKKYYNNKRIRYQGQFQAGKEMGVFKYYSALSSAYPIAIKTFKKNSNLATIKFYTEKGILESEGETIGKNRVGIWLYYHIDGETILSEETYEKGILNGTSRTFYLTGEMTEVSQYKDSELHGNLKRDADNGILLDDLNYKKGKLHGSAKYYNVAGKLIYWGDYENDEKIGKWKYVENGKSEN